MFHDIPGCHIVPVWTGHMTVMWHHMLCRYKLVQESSDSEDSAEEEYNPPPAKVAKVQTPPTKAAPKGVVQPSASKEKEEDPYGGSTDEEAEPQAIQKTSKSLLLKW